MREEMHAQIIRRLNRPLYDEFSDGPLFCFENVNFNENFDELSLAEKFPVSRSLTRDFNPTVRRARGRVIIAPIKSDFCSSSKRDRFPP